jgi:translation initiation factor IF-2
MKNGVLASMNERIDFDTASIVGEELGFKIIEAEGASEDESSQEDQKKLEGILKEKTADSQERPPVVVVMGHVDHGKTKILDAIRKTDVVAGESGGITQHIGAYQVHKNDRLITFIDTPGHEAFTAMRSRGASVADVAILVVAADDGVQPQTKEAIKIIQDAGIPFVVAINKIDRPEADVDKIKKDLSSINLLPEDWGGKVITSPVSALNGTGIDDLLDTVLLVTDMEKESTIADPNRLAIGTIVESHIDKGEGPVATILVQSGTLKVGDTLGMSGGLVGKVKALKDYNNKAVNDAPPGTPVRILGLKMAPEVGSILEVASDPKKLSKNVKQQKQKQASDFSTRSKPTDDESGVKFINLTIKADVLGSLEAIIESLAKLETSDIKIKITGKGLGIITEADVLKAEATKSKIIGFHVKPNTMVSNLARDKEVEIKYHDVIYHLIEEIEEEMKGMIDKEVVRKLIGKLEILKVFRKETKSMIVGGRVIEGGICICDTVIITRGGEAMSSGSVKRLECAKQSTDKVGSGQECGITFEGKPIIEEGDILEFYEEE